MWRIMVVEFFFLIVRNFDSNNYVSSYFYRGSNNRKKEIYKLLCAMYMSRVEPQDERAALGREGHSEVYILSIIFCIIIASISSISSPPLGATPISGSGRVSLLSDVLSNFLVTDFDLPSNLDIPFLISS